MCIHVYVCIDGYACIIKAVSSSWAGDVFGIIYTLNTSVNAHVYVWMGQHLFGFGWVYVYLVMRMRMCMYIRLCFIRGSMWIYVCSFVYSYDWMYVCVFIYDVNVGVVLEDENNIIFWIRLQIWMQLRYTKEHIILLLINR